VGDPPAPPGQVQDAVLAPAVLPRLTNLQYRNAVVDLLGDGLSSPALEPDTNPYLFFNIGAASTSISELGVQQLEEAADALTGEVFADSERRVALVGCEPADLDDPCIDAFIERFGERAFRRPLSGEELAQWDAVAADLGAEAKETWVGLRLVVAGMLQSPNFIYRVELGEPDPEDPERLRYTGYEMATRLSFLLWNTTPDDELLAAAGAGDLHVAEGIEAQTRRLLDSPRAREAVQDFFAQFFDLGRLEGLTRSEERYPDFSVTMPESMRTEVKLLVDDFVNRRDADVRGVFSTRRTFVNDELAELYGVDAPGASPIAFVPVELPEEGPRMGMLTLGAFLTMNAHETETSPTLRGKYVRERVLCQDVPPPPDNVDTDIDQDPGMPQTLRERLEQHRKNPLCAACHAFIDPPGFLFENFDSVGAFRTEEAGHPIDATGDLDGDPLANARDLAERLIDDPRVGRCMVKQLYRHAQARLDDDGEGPAIDELTALFEERGYRFRELLVLFTTHESFRFVAKSEVSP
jgi:hypothetical protein